MTYNVFITTEEAQENERCVLKDLADLDLRRRFVKPFMRGRTLLLDNNELLPASKVRRVKITSTVNALQLEVDRENDERQASNDTWNREHNGLVFLSVGFYGVDDANNLGNEVTADFIKDAPHPAGLIGKILNHGWTVQFVGSVIAAAIGLYVLKLFT